MTKTNTIGTQIKVLDILYPDCSTIGDALPDVTLGTEGVCVHCGHTLTVRVRCEDEHGNVFELGRTCAASQEGVHALALKTVEEKAEARRMRSLVASPEFVAWAKGLPHPKGWARKTLLDDVQYWAGRGNWVNVRQALAAWRGQSVEGASKVSAKDQQRLDAIQATLDKAEAIKVAFEAACVAEVEQQKAAKVAVKEMSAAGVDALVIANFINTAFAPINVYEYTNGYSDYGMAKLQAALGRAGIKSTKVPSLYDLENSLRAIATKYGV